MDWFAAAPVMKNRDLFLNTVLSGLDSGFALSSKP